MFDNKQSLTCSTAFLAKMVDIPRTHSGLARVDSTTFTKAARNRTKKQVLLPQLFRNLTTVMIRNKLKKEKVKN